MCDTTAKFRITVPPHRATIAPIARGSGCLTESSGVRLSEDHIYAPALQESGELAFHAHEVETWNVARLKFDQYVNVAIRAEVVAKNRAEQRESLDAVASTECRHGIPIDRDLRAHLICGGPPINSSGSGRCVARGVALH